MKKIILICIIFILASFTIAGTWDGDTRVIKRINELRHDSGRLGAYRALIFGINDYKDSDIPDLKTAVRDATAMSEVLQERYGFETKLILNRDATRAAMYNALMNTAAKAKPDESIILYYAGHGELDRKFENNEDGWWIPADAKAGDPTTFLDNFQVQKAMKNTKAKHVLLISDSCYAGTLFGRARAMPPKITDNYYLGLYNETSRWGMTSGNKEPVSDRGTKGHSIFAYQLLKALHQNTKPYLSVQELYAGIAPIIGNNSEQTPLCLPVRMTGDQGGGFVFVLADNKPEQPEIILPPKKSRLTVTSNVPGSVVWIGGSKYGEMPVSVDISQAGNYVIRVKAEGYEDFEIRKFVDLSDDVEVKAELKKLRPAIKVKPLNAGNRLKPFPTTNSLGMKFVYIEPGAFMMGSPESEPGRLDNEKLHSVMLTNGYFMQTTEVTQGQWKAVMGNNPSNFKNCGEDCPVETISWEEVQEFIKKLNQKEGTDKYRLPTEAEWEFAARAGSNTAFANGPINDTSCNDSNMDSMGWYCGNAGNKTHPVGRKEANELGLYDMHGNVYEWCHDWFGNYPIGYVTDPVGPSSGSLRVRRGGEWYDHAQYCRSAFRGGVSPGVRSNDLGFRLLREP